MRLEFDPDDASVNAYRLLTSLVVPRPIAWVSSRSADGVGNLAPHSFFTVACADPPMITFSSIGRKDTLANITATGEFTVNVATEPMLDQVNASSARFGPEVDEAAELGITLRPSVRVAPMTVADSPATLECTLHSTVDLGTAVLVLGRVVWLTIAEESMADGRPSYAGLAPLARLGGSEWGLPGPTISVRRPG